MDSGMPIIQGTWRGSHLTKFGYLEKRAQSDESLRAQQRADALRALKAVLPATEYEAMAGQCVTGEREVRLEDGFILTSFSPRHAK
jgi:hypothetical protein